MKKIFSLLLVFGFAILLVGTQNIKVSADEAATTLQAADYDTTLPEDVAVIFDSAFGLEASANQYTVTDVVATSDGGYIAAGTVVVDGWSWIKAEIIKYDSDFNVEFTVSLDTDWWTFINAIEQDSNGDYWVFTTEEVVSDNGTPVDESDDITSYPRRLHKIDGTTHAIVGTFNSTADAAAQDWSAEWQSNSIVELGNENVNYYDPSAVLNWLDNNIDGNPLWYEDENYYCWAIIGFKFNICSNCR